MGDDPQQTPPKLIVAMVWVSALVIAAWALAIGLAVLAN